MITLFLLAAILIRPFAGQWVSRGSQKRILIYSAIGEGLSYFSMAMGLAMVFGPYIGLRFANINAYVTAFIVCIAISAVNIVLSFFIKVPKSKESPIYGFTEE